MNFALVIVVLLNYFIRLQDWVPGMAGLNVMNVLMAFAILATVTRREGFDVRVLVATPVDWAMLAYLGYIVIFAPSGDKPIGEVAVLFAYYAVTSLALDSPARLNRFLLYWLIALVVLAVMAVISEFGLDLTGAREITHAKPDEPRLVLNTYLFNNPNALGHTVVTVVPLAYLLLFWRGRFSQKLLAMAAVAIALYCAYLTKSKGAYLVGFLLLVLSVLLGRSVLFQVLALLLAMTIGFQAIQNLPRMTDLDGLKRDEGVMGRVLAWELAREVSREQPGGVGFKKHESYIEWEGQTIKKATHGSYVRVGAELGSRGMFFYLAVLYACLRCLATSRRDDLHEEASRKALFALLAGYMASGWMIDRSYHLEYFLLAGAVSAYFRRIQGEEAAAIGPSEERKTIYSSPVSQALISPGNPDQGVVADVPRFPPYEIVSFTPQSLELSEPEVSAQGISSQSSQGGSMLGWRRWGLIDLLLVLLMCKIVFSIWDEVLKLFLY